MGLRINQLKTPGRLCHLRAAEVTRPSLQSLVVDMFGVFYSFFSEVLDCTLHTPDNTPGIATGTRMPDRHIRQDLI